MAIAESKSIVRLFFEGGPSRGDLAAASALLAPDFFLHGPGQGQGNKRISAFPLYPFHIADHHIEPARGRAKRVQSLFRAFTETT